MKRTLYTYFTDRNQIAQPDATRVLGPIAAMPIHKKDDNDSLYNMLPEVVVTAKYPHEQRVIDTMNASNAEFMRRLRNNDKRAIHNQDGSYSTHVLGSADNIVFPAIQDVNGELKDYRGLPWQRTLDKAIQNNDYIEFPTEGDARYFGEHYKKYFPEYFSNQYADGGEMDTPKHWNELSMADKSDAIASAVRNGVTTLEDIRKAWDDYADSGYREDSSYRDNSEDMGNTLDDYDDTYQEETHEYLKGGYKPSAAIKNRIANWEGSSMQTNRSFEAEAKDFWNAIPSNVRSKLTQQQADALYSYSYNVGAGNFKKRVVPSLERYFNGNGSVEDVQRHMYATKDKDYRGLAKRRAVERAMFGGQRVEDVSSFDYDYSSNSSPYGHRFTVNNNFQTAGYLGPIVNGNSVNNDNTNKTNIFLQALEDEPKQTIAESTPEPRYNALERLQNIYSMYGMDDYAQEIGKYNPFEGLMFAEGGKKSTDTKGVTSSNGQYHVNPTNYWAVLGNAESGKPVEVTTPEITVTAADPKKYRSDFHSEDIFPFMNIATAGLLNRGSVTQNVKLLKDAYDVVVGQKPWKNVADSAILGNEGIFSNPYINFGIDMAIPIGGIKAYSLRKPISQGITEVVDKAWHSTWAQYPRYYAGKLYYGMDAELPTLYRKLRDIPQVTDGKIQISPINNRLAYMSGEESPVITNMTTDVPVRPHSSSWDDADVLVFSGKNLLGKHVISTRPSDTFTFGDVITINPKKVTYLSGRPRALRIAEQRGMNTLTSDQAKNVARKHVFGNSTNYSDYRVALQNLTRHNFKSPTLKDYKFMDWVFQPMYKSKVTPFQDLSNPTIEQINNSPEWLGELFGNQLYRNYLSNPKEWRNVLYHPASSVEYQFRKLKGIEFKDEIPDNN